MMGTFAALNSGSGDIGASTGAITGGVAEALIATMCGLAIAITGLLPFNYLNARLDEVRHEIEDASNSLEIIINKSSSTAAR
jgi:biopolymer transport protein ExbB